MTELVRQFPIQLLLVLSGMVAHAQVSPLQNILNKIKNHKNFSYESVYKQKDNGTDTFVIENRYLFEKALKDTSIGYLFSLESQLKGRKFPTTRFYNGQNLIEIDPNESIYTTRKIRSSEDDGSMLSYVKLLEGLFETKPSQIAPDTTVDGISCTHIVMNTYDTVIDKEHYYTRIHLLIDKGIGDACLHHWKNQDRTNRNAISNYYMEYKYFNYTFDQDNVDIASMTVPTGFHLPEQYLSLLPVGTPAPDWILYSEKGKRVALSELKGKVILMDFFFIGCWPCMQSLKPINHIHGGIKIRRSYPEHHPQG